jgi:hypothetical protein
MRHDTISALTAVMCCASSAQGQALQARVLKSESAIGRPLIVGRAVCGSATWLLTDVPELFRLSLSGSSGPTVSSVPLQGLQNDEKPWGLACLPDTELWTLTAHDVLARVDPSGKVAERVPLDHPRLGIFSAGTRLLLQQPPSGATRPLLAAGLPRRLSAFVPWPSPLSQPTPTRAELLKANLVKCGIGADAYVPCWLATQETLTISDGSRAHTTIQDLRFARSEAADDEVPIQDVALWGTKRVWVLAATRTGLDGRRVGGRLTKSDRGGTAGVFVDLNPPARLIVRADDDRCVLLSSTGQLLEVSER